MSLFSSDAMHNAVLNRIKETPAPVQLARIGSKRGTAIVCAFTSEDAAPLWVAKTARNPEGIVRLKNEQQALAYLEPWAALLHIPRVLAWEESGSQACLIISGVDGQQTDLALPVDASLETVRQSFGPAARWLRTFWSKVPSPTATSVNESADSLARRLRVADEWRERMEGVIGLLARGRPGGDASPVPMHGDFFPMNVTLCRGELSVIDWDHFDGGLPLHDLFSFVANSYYIRKRRICTKTEVYLHVFFSQSPVSRFLREQIQEQRIGPELARFYFYGYLARQILTETCSAPPLWYPLLEKLKQLDYPCPDIL
jgi:aminoglycoside phosphotransferase (APT) family kinase protein